MASNSQGAGAYANLTAAQLDADLAGDAQAVLGALSRAHRRYIQYWLPMGQDAVQGYQALKTAAGDPAAAADYATAATAAVLMEKLYQVLQGNAYIAQDGTDSGNGTVTVGADGSGFNFAVFLHRVSGDVLA